MRKQNPAERVDKSEGEGKQAPEKEAAFDDVHNRKCIESCCVMLRRRRNVLA